MFASAFLPAGVTLTQSTVVTPVQLFRDCLLTWINSRQKICRPREFSHMKTVEAGPSWLITLMIMQSHQLAVVIKSWNDIDGTASGQNEPTIIRRRRADAGQGRNDEDDDFTFEELLDGSKVL